MVAKFLSVKETNRNYQKLISKNRRRSWLYTIGIGVILVVVCFVTTYFWQKLILLNYPTTDFKIKQNLSWNTPETTNYMQINKVKNGTDTFRVVCYYVCSNDSSRFIQLPPNYIDPFLCTHIIAGFAYIENATIQPLPNLELYKQVINLKNSNPSLKILISVGERSSNGEFARVVSRNDLRMHFATSTVTFLNSTGFDGVDLDWEFPSWPDADLMQARNFSLLLKEFRQLINSSFKNSNRNFLLSVAVGSPELIMRQSYEIKEMAAFVDFVNLMSYDYHLYSQYLPLTGPNAPLYRRDADTGYMVTLNTNWSATHWVSWGMPKSKINVGIPTYGHSFRLVNENNNGWNAPASGFGSIGTGDGFLSYFHACEFIKNPETTHIFDDEYDVPYAYNRNEWISYDNPVSVQLKAIFIKENKFGGAMVYSLNNDDFTNKCSSQKFPLTRIINNILM